MANTVAARKKVSKTRTPKAKTSQRIFHIFSNKANTPQRHVSERELLEEIVSHCKKNKLKVVLTQGSYDLLHIGHARYLEAAKNCGDFLIVGLDSDKKIQLRKGPERPIIPQEERIEMLTHLRSVDVVVVKEHNAPKWDLIKLIRPDVLVAIHENYEESEIPDLQKHCGEVRIFPRQAETSTSAKIRLLQIGVAAKLEKALTPRIMESIRITLDEIKGDK